MHCPSCGFENPVGLKFCNECGAPLRMPCTQYGLANPPQAKFCSECAVALPSQTGASTTLLLARCGYRVLLVDRATFLSDTPSTPLVQQAGVLWLNRGGPAGRDHCLELPVNCAGPLRLRRFSLTGAPPINGIPAAYAPRKTPHTPQGITDAFQDSSPSESCSSCPSSCGSRAHPSRSRWRVRTMRPDMSRRVYALARPSKGKRVHARLTSVSSCTPETHRQATPTTYVTRRRLPARETASPLE
jgi:hypothetical protein